MVEENANSSWGLDVAYSSESVDYKMDKMMSLLLRKIQNSN